MKYNSKIIIACDFDNLSQLSTFLDKFNEKKLFLKLGAQIIYSEGMHIIKYIKDRGHNIFLDLKLLDIPTTTKKALEALLFYSPDFITIHISSGLKTLQEAQISINNTKTRLLGVSVLTSMSQNDLISLNISKNIGEHIADLMNIAKEAKLYGVICSGFEASIARSKMLISVVPGIRLEQDSNNDQQRIMTPALAIKNGADFLVIGRSITKSNNPYKTYKAILKEIS